jgi:hypothetical protein
VNVKFAYWVFPFGKPALFDLIVLWFNGYFWLASLRKNSKDTDNPKLKMVLKITVIWSFKNLLSENFLLKINHLFSYQFIKYLMNTPCASCTMLHNTKSLTMKTDLQTILHNRVHGLWLKPPSLLGKTWKTCWDKCPF